MDKNYGILKVYDPTKGFGFITRPVGKDVFVWYHDFVNHKDVDAVEGSHLEFDIEDTPNGKGPRAINVKVVG